MSGRHQDSTDRVGKTVLPFNVQPAGKHNCLIQPEGDTANVCHPIVAHKVWEDQPTTFFTLAQMPLSDPKGFIIPDKWENYRVQFFKKGFSKVYR